MLHNDSKITMVPHRPGRDSFLIDYRLVATAVAFTSHARDADVKPKLRYFRPWEED